MRTPFFFRNALQPLLLVGLGDFTCPVDEGVVANVFVGQAAKVSKTGNRLGCTLYGASRHAVPQGREKAGIVRGLANGANAINGFFICKQLISCRTRQPKKRLVAFGLEPLPNPLLDFLPLFGG